MPKNDDNPDPRTSCPIESDSLSAFLDPAALPGMSWSTSDLRAILEHLLSSPCGPELTDLYKQGKLSTEPSSSLVDSAMSFADVLAGRSSNRRDVGLIKEFGKSMMSDPDGLPTNVARVVYIIAIVATRRMRLEGISSMTDDILAREARRCLTFGWLPPTVSDELRAFVQ